MAVQSPETGRLPATGVWTIDPLHSTAGFRIRHHAVASFRTRFADLEGTYDAATRTLRGSVGVESVQVIDMLRDHLQSDAFFDAANNPRIEFVSTSIAVDGGELSVDGELTMRGVRRPVHATGTITGPSRVQHYDGTAHDHIGIDLATTIDRRDFGVSFNNELLDGRLNLGWNVDLELELELTTPVDG
jgi:polyisoprenoid-binding protein YceI